MTSELLTGWDVYWITRCDGIVFLSMIGAIVLFIAATVGLMGSAFDEDEDTRKKLARLFKWTTPLFALALSAAVFTPTTKEACAILVVPAIANNEEVQGLGGDVMGAARAWLREMTPETEEDGEESR